MQDIIDNKNQKIVEDASAIFLQYGLRSTSMDDLACRMKISKKSLYKYFANKSDLVNAVLHYREELRIQKIRGFNLENYNTLSLGYIKLMLLSQFWFQNSLRNFYDVKKYYPELFDDFLQHRASLIQKEMTRFVQKGIEEGVFHESQDMPLKQAIFIKMLNELYEQNAPELKEYPLEKVMTSMFDIYIRSLATVKGLQCWEELLQQKPHSEIIEEIINQQKIFNTK